MRSMRSIPRTSERSLNRMPPAKPPAASDRLRGSARDQMPSPCAPVVTPPPWHVSRRVQHPTQQWCDLAVRSLSYIHKEELHHHEAPPRDRALRAPPPLPRPCSEKGGLQGVCADVLLPPLTPLVGKVRACGGGEEGLLPEPVLSRRRDSLVNLYHYWVFGVRVRQGTLGGRRVVVLPPPQHPLPGDPVRAAGRCP